MSSASRTTALTGSQGNRNGRVSKLMSALALLLLTAGADKVVRRHRPVHTQFGSSLPVRTEALDDLVELIFLVVLQEEGDIDGVELMGRFPDGYGHTVVLHAGQEERCVLVAPVRDGVVDDLAQAHSFLARSVGVLATDLLAELR